MFQYKKSSVGYLNDDEEFAEKISFVTDERKEKISKLKFRKDKNLSLGAGLLLNSMLCNNDIYQIKGIPQVGLSERGKPVFKNMNNRWFNLSHSGEMVLCAIGDSPVGCDIEKIVYSPNECLKIAETIFNKKEISFIKAAGIQEIPFRFYQLWTQKEACAKCFDVPLTDILNKSVGSLLEEKKYFIITKSDSGYVYSVVGK